MCKDFVCLCVCLFVCLFGWLFACLFACLVGCLFGIKDFFEDIEINNNLQYSIVQATTIFSFFLFLFFGGVNYTKIYNGADKLRIKGLRN